MNMSNVSFSEVLLVRQNLSAPLFQAERKQPTERERG